MECREHGNESVQFAVKPQFGEQVGAIGLERAPEVLEVHSRHLPDQPVGNPRGKPAGQESVDPLRSPAVGKVVALVDLRDQPRDVLGRVLEIAVHGHNDLSTRERGIPLQELLSVLNSDAVGPHAAGFGRDAALSSAALSSVDASSTMTISNERPSASSTTTSRSMSDGRFGPSLWAGNDN